MRGLILAVSLFALNAAAQPLTLEQCAARAVAHATQVAEAQVLEARAATVEAEGRGPLPQFSAGVTWAPPQLGRAQGDWLAPGTLRSTAGVDFPFALTRDPFPSLQARARLAHALDTARLARSEAAAEGIEACLRLQEARRAVRWAGQRLELELEAREAGLLRLAAAVLLPAEASTLEARLADAESGARAAEAERKAAETVARAVLGLPEGPLELSVPEPLEAPPAAALPAPADWAPAEVLGSTLRQLPGTGRAASAVREHQIDLFAQVGVDTPGSGEAALFGLVGARYTVDLGGGSLRAARNDLAQARDALERARSEAEARERSTRTQAAAAALEAARAAVLARSQEREQARAMLSLAQARGELGAAGGRDEETPPSLLRARAELVLADGAVAETRHRALLAAVELWRAAGAGEALAAALRSGAGIAQPPAAGAAQQFAALGGKGLWVWQTGELLAQPQQAARLWEFCRRWGFGRVYLFVGEPGDPKSPLRRPRELAALVRQARQADLEVDALGGDPEWLDAAGRPRALALAQAVSRWQQLHPPEERFGALHLDVEPHSVPAWKEPASRPALLSATVSIFEEAARAVRPLPVAADVPDTIAEPDLVRILAVVDRVAIMAYRVRAGEASRRAAPLCALAARHGKRAVVALDTAQGGEAGTTFFGNPDGLFAAAQDLTTRLASSPACAGGVAVHDERGLVSTLRE